MSEVNAVKNEQVKRTHDEFYLQLNRKSTPKEYFKFVDRHVRQFRSLDGLRVVDIGCATGDFLHFLAELYPQAKLYGYDVLDTLLSRARTEVTRATFSRVNISEPDLQSKDQSFDVAFMLGVHSIFDDLHWLNNALSLLRPGGHFYCFGLFNTMDVDVFVKARKSGAKACHVMHYSSRASGINRAAWRFFTVANYRSRIAYRWRSISFLDGSSS